MTALFSSSPHTSLQPTRRSNRPFLAIICLSALAVAPAAAETATWSGLGSDNNWSTIENWVAGAIPPADAEVVFPASAPRRNNVNNIGVYAFNSITIVDEYTITSTYAITTPTINASATATLAVPLVMPGAELITIIQQTGTATLSLTKIVSGTGAITFGGPGIIEFTGAQANTYTGLTRVQTTGTGFLRLARTAESIPSDLTITATGKVVVVAGSSQIYYASLVTVDGALDISLASGLDSGVDNETIGALAGIGAVNLGTRKLGCFYAPLNSTYSGILVGTASSSVRKHGSYEQKLSGTSAGFLGTTVLNGSNLTVLGTQTSSNISATAGTLKVAQLASVGSITMTGTSNLAIGNEPEVENQAFSKSLSLASTSRMDVFSGSTAGHSTLTVVGSVALGGATLTVNTDVAPPTAGTDIMIIDNDGVDAVSGTFASLPEGAELISSGATPIAFTISYVGGANANDVVLTALAAPTIASPAITSATTATGTVGEVFIYQITTSPAATSYTASNLPTGLAINTATGEISGTPTIAENKNVLLTASNASGTGSGTVAITIDGTGPGIGGGNPLPPGPTSSGSSSSSGCGAGGATGLALALVFGLTLAGSPIRQRR